MGPGVFLAVVGAILTFAVRADASVVDLQVVGVILMVAGAAVIAHARKGVREERVVTEEVHPSAVETAPDLPTHHVMKESTVRRD